MKKIFVVSAITFLFACGQQPAPANPSAAADAADASVAALQAATLPPSIAPIAWLVGNWRCTGSYVDLPPLISAHPVVASFTVTPAIDGLWLHTVYAERQTQQNPNPLLDSEFAAVDESIDANVRAGADNNLGRIMATGTGYDTDVTTYTGTYTGHGVTLGYGQTITRVNNAKFLSSSTLDLGAGPQVYGTLTCVK